MSKTPLFDRLRNTVLAYRDRALMAVMLWTGVRIGTICRLEVRDVRPDDNDPKLRIQEKGRLQSKRELGIHVEAADLIKEYLENGGPTSGALFPPRLNSRSEKLAARHMDEDTMYRLLMSYLVQLPRAITTRRSEDGEEERKCIFSPHSLRATTATLLLDKGIPIQKVQALLGHKNISTTQLYNKRRLLTRDSASHDLDL